MGLLSLIFKDKKKKISVKDWFLKKRYRDRPNKFIENDHFFSTVGYRRNYFRTYIDEAGWVENVIKSPHSRHSIDINLEDIGRGHPIQLLFKRINEKSGIENKQAVKLFDQYIVGYCFKCNILIDGNTMQMFEAVNNSGGAIGMDSSMSRMADGFCPNESCRSKGIALCWTGDAEPKDKYLNALLNRD